jgi:hypothetical protein
MGSQPPTPAGLLVTLSQRPAVRTQPVQAGAVLAEPGARAELLRLARELGVEGLGLSALKAHQIAGQLPPDFIREIDTRLEQLRREALLWDLERDRVSHILQRHGITPVVLKGSALREQVYDDPVERSMGDLDFLVAPDEIDRSIEALRTAGYVPDREDWVEKYRRHHFHQVMNHPRGFIVELHWALTDRGSSVPLNEKQILARASLSNRGNRGNNVLVRVPSPEDLLLHVVSQNEDDAFGILRRIVDIDRVVASSPDLDWQYLVRAASDARLDLVLAVSLRLAQLLLRTDVPSNLSRGSRIPILPRVHLAMLDPAAWVVSLPSERRAVAFETMRLWCASTWSARARRAAETLRGESLRMVFDSADERQPNRWRITNGGVVRAMKLATYHVLVYGRASLALASPSGRRRLRFWTEAP